MPWVDQVLPCVHPDRPPAVRINAGRVWQCGDCMGRWRVVIVDFGHDVMPGESPSEPQWELMRRG